MYKCLKSSYLVNFTFSIFTIVSLCGIDSEIDNIFREYRTLNDGPVLYVVWNVKIQYLINFIVWVLCQLILI